MTVRTPAAILRTDLGTPAGVMEMQPGDTFDPAYLGANLAAFAGLTGAPDRLPYFTGAGAMSLTTITAVARTLLAAADKAAQRTALALGTAATSNVQTSAADVTSGRLLSVGSFGLGAECVSLSGTDLDTLTATGWYYIASAVNGPLASNTFIVWHIQGTSARARQYAYRLGSNEVYTRYRNTTWGAWALEFNADTAASLPLATALAPSTDNNRTCGTAALRWSTVYAGTGTINTSDARTKTPVRPLTAAELAAAQQLSGEIGAYQFLDAIEAKGAAARQHIGMTVQRAIEILQAHALDPFAYGFICYDQWERQTVEHPAEYEQVNIPAVLAEDGTELEPARTEQGALIREAWTAVTVEAGDRYSFRMDELLAFVARGQAERLNALEQRLAALEAA